MESRLPSFCRQTWALARKTLLIVVVKHWLSTSLRAVVLPVAFMILLVNIKSWIYPDNGYGIGSPAPIASLDEVLPRSHKLVFMPLPDLGNDVAQVIAAVTKPLQAQSNIIVLNDESDLLATCPTNQVGDTDCFAAVIFTDSPMTVGKSGTWAYTLRANDGSRNFRVS